MRGLSLAVASGGHSSSRCAGLSPSRPLPLWSTSSRRAGSAAVAHGPSRSEACGILPDQGSNPCPLHWQADSQPLHHQGSPLMKILISHFGNLFFTLLLYSYSDRISQGSSPLSVRSLFQCTSLGTEVGIRVTIYLIEYLLTNRNCARRFLLIIH